MTKSSMFTPVRWVCGLLALLLLLSVLPFQAFATGDPDDDENVAIYTITGDFQEGKFDLSGEDGRLFHLDDILPGDKWVGEIHIKNKSPGQMAISLLTITSNIKNQTLFDALDLDVSYKGKNIYSGKYNTGLSKITPAYIVDPKDTLVLDVEVELPLSATNAVAGKFMDSTWTFEATYTEKPQTGGNLATENTANLYILWILLFAAFGAVVVAIRIRYTIKAQQKQSKEVNKL